MPINLHHSKTPLLKLSINLTSQIATVLLSDYTSASPPPLPLYRSAHSKGGKNSSLGNEARDLLEPV